MPTHEPMLQPVVTPNWWQPRTTPDVPAGYAELVERMRELQDVLVSSAPHAATVAEVTELLTAAVDVLRPTVVDEWSRISGFASELPNRGSFLLPHLVVSEDEGDQVSGTVRFTPYYLGGNGAVHGGSIPLLFDEVLGSLANAGGRSTARTAYLHVDYRSITPVDQDLHLEARLVRESGRKRWVQGVIRDSESVCAEAEGLFVELLPGQR